MNDIHKLLKLDATNPATYKLLKTVAARYAKSSQDVPASEKTHMDDPYGTWVMLNDGRIWSSETGGFIDLENDEEDDSEEPVVETQPAVEPEPETNEETCAKSFDSIDDLSDDSDESDDVDYSIVKVDERTYRINGDTFKIVPEYPNLAFAEDGICFNPTSKKYVTVGKYRKYPVIKTTTNGEATELAAVKLIASAYGLRAYSRTDKMSIFGYLDDNPFNISIKNITINGTGEMEDATPEEPVVAPAKEEVSAQALTPEFVLVPGFEKYIAITKEGRVRRVDDGKILPRLQIGNFMYVQFRMNGKTKSVNIARAVLATYKGIDLEDKKTTVKFIDGDIDNCTLENLEVTSRVYHNNLKKDADTEAPEESIPVAAPVKVDTVSANPKKTSGVSRFEQAISKLASKFKGEEVHLDDVNEDFLNEEEKEELRDYGNPDSESQEQDYMGAKWMFKQKNGAVFGDVKYFSDFYNGLRYFKGHMPKSELRQLREMYLSHRVDKYSKAWVHIYHGLYVKKI